MRRRRRRHPGQHDELVHQPGDRDDRPRATALRLAASTTTGTTFASPITNSQLTELGRLRLLYQPDPEFQVGASVGYEHNAFPFTTYSGATYGAGYKWRPSPRTVVGGFWEHRYFGSSYGFKFDYRTPLSVWGVNASRNVTSYPQQLATLCPPAATSRRCSIRFFSSRIADPAERQQARRSVHSRPRPAEHAVQSRHAVHTAAHAAGAPRTSRSGLLGARNSIFFTASTFAASPSPDRAIRCRRRSPARTTTRNGRQYRVQPSIDDLVSLGANLSWSRTVPNAPIAFPEHRRTSGRRT